MRFIIDTTQKKAYLVAEQPVDNQVLLQIAPLIGLSGVPCDEIRPERDGENYSLELSERR
jgi:hypothetical protein